MFRNLVIVVVEVILEIVVHKLGVLVLVVHKPGVQVVVEVRGLVVTDIKR